MANAPLEPDEALARAWLDAFGEASIDELLSIPKVPAVGTVGEEGHRRAAELSLPIPEQPLEGGTAQIVETLGAMSRLSLHTPGPGYLAYVPGGGIFSAALADLYACVTNRYTGVVEASPGFSRLEADVLRWLCTTFGYGDKARGLFTSGGSLANFGAVVSAREQALGDSGDLRGAIAYTSAQAHHSVMKSFRLAGIATANVRQVPVDEGWRIDPKALAEQVAADRAAGLRPFVVVCAAGSTNTGAIDPLPELADVCEEHGLWLHVDGAYGGAFVLCERGKKLLEGIERADSITFDPHKGMFLPYGTGCLLVREGEALRRAHQVGADYLQDFDLEREDMPPNPADYGPELSRDYRGIRVWLPLMLHGAKAFRDALDEKLELADRFCAGLDARLEAGEPWEIVARPQSSTVAFRLQRHEGESLDDWNARNAALMAGVNRRARVYLSSTALPVEDGAAFTLRVCVLSFRTHAEQIDHCLEDLDASRAELG